MRNKCSLFLLIIITLIMTIGCQKHGNNPEERDLLQVKSTKGDNSKKIIYLMIDSLMAQAIEKGIQLNELPTFKYLTEHGQFYNNMVSSFPTMSVTIDSSLLTGAYPNVHHVPGLTWYSTDEKRVINYGTGPMEVFRHGSDSVLIDALINLNGKHLNQQFPTIYDELAKQGLRSGSINGLIYRGNVGHTLSIPSWIQGISSIPTKIEVKGPDYFTLGSLSNPLANIKKLPDGLTSRMGLNNSFAIETAKYLIRKKQLPDFLFVYLPDLDRKLHKNGPSEKSGVKEVDQQLQSLLQAFGSPEEALRDTIFIISGDSGMTQIMKAQENPVIDLPSLFRDYDVLRPGEAVSSETDIILAVNETMAYVYTLKADKSLRGLADRLAEEERIDIISWRENNWIHVVQGNTAKSLKFRADGNRMDEYKQKWTIEGDLEVLDLKLNSSHSVDYGQYPDVLQRLFGALNSHTGQFLVVTSKPGYELADRSSPTHKGGGGHGSIRQKESLIPLIICGTDQKPQYLRIVDIKTFILDILLKKGK